VKTHADALAAPADDRVELMTRGLVVAFGLGVALSITLAESALVALGVWLLATSRGRPPRGWPLLWPVTAFAAWTVVTAILSARPLQSIGDARSFLALGSLYALVHALPNSVAARRFALGLLALMGAVSVLAIVQVGLCHQPMPDMGLLVARLFRKCDRARGLYSIYMTLAGVLSLVLVTSLPRLLEAPRRPAWAAPAWLVSAVALALTAVRGAWLGVGVGVLGVVLVGRRRWAALVAVVLLAVGVLVLLPAVRHRAATIGDPSDPTTRDRLAMWQGGLAIARDHWLTGIGPGRVEQVYPRYAPPEAIRRERGHLHNSPLQILVERGVPGLVLWLWIFAEFFVRAARALRDVPPDATEDRSLVVGATSAVAAFLVAGLFEHNFGDTEVLLVAGAVMALPLVVARDYARPPDEMAHRGEGGAQ
jgi:O-antigen ligase